MTDRRTPTLEEIAYHEAGHAVVAHRSIVYRLKPMGNVSIDSAGDEHGGIDAEPQPDANVPGKRIEFESCIVSAAGYAAQERYLAESNAEVDQKPIELGASDDLKRVRDIYGPGVFFDFVTIATKRLSDGEAWKAVQRLAIRLLRDRTLSTAEAISEIEQ